MIPEINLNPFPFYWRVKSEPSSHEYIPEKLPYKITLDPELNLIIEERSTSLLETLRVMYREESNIGFLQDGHSLATAYGDDFLRVIHKMVDRYSISSALEVGCGGCYLLERVAAMGVSCLGIDPSPVAHIKASEKQLKVIDDFYPSTQLNEQFDLIYHVDVLEHVANPVDFLNSHLVNLSKDGVLIVNVPDNTRAIELGDISLVSHQHLNSFDENSLYQTLSHAGYKTIDILKSEYGGSLYGIATPSRSSISSAFKPSVSPHLAREFFSKASSNINRFSNLANDLIESGQSLGFYMPLRSFPYLAAANIIDKVRLFDDISHWHNSYIGSSRMPIENFNDLCREPVDRLFIMSHSFGESLKKKVMSQIPTQQVILLSDFLIGREEYEAGELNR